MRRQQEELDAWKRQESIKAEAERKLQAMQAGFRILHAFFWMIYSVGFWMRYSVGVQVFRTEHPPIWILEEGSHCHL